MRVTLLIPEFPGQTHAFFWREIEALKANGVTVQILSTRRPPKILDCHTWSSTAACDTNYALPFKLHKVVCSVVGILFASPLKWIKCLNLIVRADGEDLRGRLRMLGLFVVAGYFAFLVRRFGSRHVHAHSCGDSAYLAAFASILAGRTYSLTLHSEIGFFGNGQEVKWRNASFGMVVSNKTLSEMRAQVAATMRKQIVVVPMGVDPEFFKRDKEYSPFYDGETLNVVSCGRLCPGKGHADILHAISELSNCGYRIRLSILGEGEDRVRLSAIIAELGLGDSVQLYGAVCEAIVRERLSEAHLFVLASHSEAIGVATMEAMAMGVPVIVTDVGGVSELVRHTVDGLLVSPGDPIGLTRAIIELAGQPELAIAMSRSGEIRIRKHFHSARSARALMHQIELQS